MVLVSDHSFESNSDLGGKASDETCSMSKPVVEVQVHALAATSGGCAVFLGNDEKAFVIYVGNGWWTEYLSGRLWGSADHFFPIQERF
jgi:hypothetical protein